MNGQKQSQYENQFYSINILTVFANNLLPLHSSLAHYEKQKGLYLKTLEP